MKKPPKSSKIRKMTPRLERFARGVIADVTKRFEKPRGELFGWYDPVDRKTGFIIESYNLIVLHQDDKVYWMARVAGGGQVAGGGILAFRSRPKLLVESRAALRPEHRGRGIYPFVLKELRRQFKRPLQSDRELTDSNRRAWIRAGAVEDGIRYRINPPQRLTLQEQWDLAWLLTEGPA